MMLLTPNNNHNNINQLRPTQEDFLHELQDEVHLRQVRHEQHLRMLRELLRQQVFHSPAARSKLMQEIRIRTKHQYTTTLWDYKINVVLQELLHMTTVFGACPSRRVALMEEIRAVGCMRAEQKENHKLLKEELPHAVWRRHMMKELHLYVSSRHLIRDMKTQMLLELHRQKALRFPSRRKRLLREIRAFGKARTEVKQDHKLVMMELHLHVSSRHLIRDMKTQMLQELHREKAFRFPSRRKRLLREIRSFGQARAEVKQNHELTMLELHQHFAKELQRDKRTALMEELCNYTAALRTTKEKKKEMLLELRAHQAFRRPSMRRKLVYEIHKQTSQRNVIKVFKDELMRDLKVFYSFNKLLPGHASLKHSSSSVSAAA